VPVVIPDMIRHENEIGLIFSLPQKKVSDSEKFFLFSSQFYSMHNLVTIFNPQESNLSLYEYAPYGVQFSNANPQ